MPTIPSCFLLTLAMFALGIRDNPRYNYNQALDEAEGQWVDSVFNALSEPERVGQLLFIRAHSDKDSAYEQSVEDLIRNFKVGGLCFFQGTAEKQAALTNRYQAASARLPLLISMDAEWGFGMRLKESNISYPRQLMLGAIRDNRLIYDMGREIARQSRRLGVHIDFAPVADVNNNPANPVINDRSFGEDRNNVAAKCFQYMMGLQDGDILACAKHFPGHGDTNIDSHADLPLIPYPIERLDSLELFPFRVLSQYGIASMMVAHLNVPSIDARERRPTTLSHPAVTDLLRKKMGFGGLIFTDAMEMQGVAKYFAPGEADLEALRAGNDVILLPGNCEAAINAVLKALDEGSIPREQVYASIKRVLRAKYRLGLNRPQTVEVANIRRDMNTPEAWMIKRRLIANALTLVRDQSNVVGFQELEKYRFATLAVGDTNRTVFQQFCDKFAPMAHFNAGKEVDSLQTQNLLDTLQAYDMVLLSLHGMRSRAVDNFGLAQSQIDLVNQLSARGKLALTVFGNPYALRFFDACPTVLEAYNEDPVTQEMAAQALFGASDLRGVLPVTASPAARYGQGIELLWTSPRLGYDLPETVGLSSDTLALMDTLVREIIASGAAPGCQILVARNGKIVWNKAYGAYTYDPNAPAVRTENLYDLASVTKVGASTLAAMRLVDEGKIKLQAPMSAYVPELLKTDKKDLTVEEILAHHAGLQPWIPFYEKTLIGLGRPSPALYQPTPQTCFEVPVAANMYMADDYVDSLWRQIFESPLRPDKSYKYSDLGLYLMACAIQNRTARPLDTYVQHTFYRSLGLATTTFTPWKYGLAERCVPTEEDDYFRHQRLQGYVHDMGAAMLGGVSGHAGLFSNANDMAKIFQMLLNGGSYFGKTYLQPETVRLFTTRYSKSTRRGIGFDMKELNPKETANMSALAGANTFGHTGFTGNAIWADPDKGLIFIFLSNRTYPTMKNNKLISGDFRPRLQSLAYRAIIKSPE